MDRSDDALSVNDYVAVSAGISRGEGSRLVQDCVGVCGDGCMKG